MTTIKVLLVLFGASLLAWVIRDVGWDAILTALRPIGVSGFFAIVLFFGFAQIPTCIGWQWVAGAARRAITLRHLYPAYAVGDAVNLTVPSADTAGEAIKVLMLKERIPWEQAVAATTLHKVAELIAVSVLLVLGLVVSWFRFDLPLWWYGIGAAVSAIHTGLVVAFFRQQARGLYGPLFQRTVARLGGSAESGALIDEHMGATLRQPGIFLWASLLVSVSWFAQVAEVYLCLHWLGLGARWDLALTIETFGLFINSVAFFIPARLGVGESGRVLLLTALGLPAPGAVAYTVVRRFREVVWVAVGYAFLVGHRKLGQVRERPLELRTLLRNARTRLPLGVGVQP